MEPTTEVIATDEDLREGHDTPNGPPYFGDHS